jgi:flagellar biosynthesis protein
LANASHTGSTTSGDAALAVALRTDPAHPAGPRVVAQAKGPLAEELRARATAHGVTLRQDGDLAALLAAVELDSDIPVAAFGAIAGILTELYRANAEAETRHG